MVVQGVTSRQRQTQTLLDAVALLEDRGITVDVNALPREDFPAPMVLERDSEWERRMFSSLLGDDLTTTQRGLVSYYESSLGRAEVREDGSFTATFPTSANGGNPSYSAGVLDQRTHGLEILQRLGFDAMVTAETENTLEVVQLWNGSPVFSCTATLTYEFGCLSEMTGTRLVGPPTADTTQPSPLSTATLLVRFRSGIIDSGDACSAIRSATQGYVLTVSPAGKPHLTPVLQLETDTSLYRVDALTGALSRG